MRIDGMLLSRFHTLCPMNQISEQQGQHCPYLVVAVFPDRVPQVIGRTFNQMDAQTHVRFLKRKLKHGQFFLVYDPEITDAAGFLKLEVGKEQGSTEEE